MISCSPLMREAVGYSHTLQCTVDFYQNGVPVWEKAPITTGSLTVDRGSKVRSNCNVSVAIPEWDDLRIDNRAGRFVVRRGVGTLGYKEALQLGEFRVDDITRPSRGVVSVSGSGLEAYLEDARFLRPRTAVRGASTIEQIQLLIREVLPAAQFKIRVTRDQRVTSTPTWDKDRLDAIDELAASIGAEVFVDSTSAWVIANSPDPLSGVPVFVVDSGSGGVLTSRKEVNTRDRVYNAAVVYGQTVDQDTPTAWAWAADLDPRSPTYFYGPFGQKPIFYASQFFSQDSQCQRYAEQLLVEALAENVSLSFTTAPVDFLEAGDLLGVRDRAGQIELLLLDSFRMSLDVTAAMSCDTISSKVIIADGI